MKQYENTLNYIIFKGLMFVSLSSSAFFGVFYLFLTDIPTLLHIVTWSCFLFFLVIYALTIKKVGLNLIIPIYCISSILFLAAAWLFSGGIKGGMGYFFVVFTGNATIIIQRKLRLLLIGLFIVTVTSLYLVETYYPFIITSFYIENIDYLLICYYAASFLMISFMVYMTKHYYIKTNIESDKKELELVHANEQKSKFIANISHEIRTPLNGLMGMTSLLENLENTKEQKEYIDIIRVSSLQLLNIINEIIEYSNQSNIRDILNNDDFSLFHVVKNTINICQSSARKKKLELLYKIDASIPISLLGDSGKLQQVLINLIGNALKFTTEGTVTLRIRKISQQNNNVTLEFSIEDTGKGIREKDLNILFEAFSQIKKEANDMNSGSGLGLNISQQLINSMGGEIQVQSAFGMGSIFYFCLEFEISDKIIAIDTKQKKRKIDPDTALKYPSEILLVEDDKFNQIFAIKLLGKMGYSIDCAPNGVEALQLLNQKHYDVLLMDVQMPIMDGLECTKKIRHGHAYQPYIIAMTANALEEDRQNCFDAGMDAFISKPINWILLEQLIIEFHTLRKSNI